MTKNLAAKDERLFELVLYRCQKHHHEWLKEVRKAWLEGTGDVRPELFKRFFDLIRQDGLRNTVYNCYRAVVESRAIDKVEDELSAIAGYIIRDFAPLELIFAEIVLDEDYPQDKRVFTISEMAQRFLYHDYDCIEILEKAISCRDELVRQHAALGLAQYQRRNVFNLPMMNELLAAILSDEIPHEKRIAGIAPFVDEGLYRLEYDLVPPPSGPPRACIKTIQHCEPTNHGKAEEGVAAMYKSYGMKTPSILWVDSPLTAWLCTIFLFLYKEYEKNEKVIFSHKQRPNLKILSKFGRLVGLARWAIFQMHRNEERSSTRHLDWLLGVEAYRSLMSVLNMRSHEEFHDPELSVHFETAINLVSPYMTPEGIQHVRKTLSDASGPQAPADEYIRSTQFLVTECKYLFVESQRIDWVDMLNHFRLLGLKPPKIEGIEDIVYSSYMCVPFESVCILVENPITTTLDEQGALHNYSQKAYAFKDGWGIRAFHGVSVPAYALVPPDSMPVEKIEAEQNVEVRRVLIEKYGTARFLQDTHAELIHEDSFGKLYRKGLLGDEPILMICVDDATVGPSGKRRQYFLRVPPTMTTAKEAVAWTFGFAAEEYKPSIET